MTAVISTHCRICRKDLTDPLSRRYGIGLECRKGMTAEQLTDAIRRNQPGYVPKATPPVSAQANRNHAEVQRVTAPVVAEKLCSHDARPASCPLCRREADPWRCAKRIIALRQQMTRDERLDTERAAARRLLSVYRPIVEAAS